MISAPQLDFQQERGAMPGWQSELIFIDGDEYFSALLHEIPKARKSIYVETYIFEYEHLGRALTRILQAAVLKGVEVRLLIDGVGSAEWISKSFRADFKFNFEVKVYHPLPWQILPSIGSRRGPGVGWIFKLFSYANSRNHRKMVIIDDEIAFIGSMNVSDVHLRSVVGDRVWHDVGVRVQGRACEDLTDAFLNAWTRGWRVASDGTLRPSLSLRGLHERKPNTLVIRNDGRVLRYQALSQRLRSIRQAREKVWLANAYFVPSGPLLRALVHAAKKGIDVRILLPECSDVNFMPWVARAFYSTLVEHGVRLFEFQPRILHSKVMLIDDTVTVGSSNLNHRSLLHDFELDVIVKNQDSRMRVQRLFEDDFLLSREFLNHDVRFNSPWKTFLVKCLLYFRFML